MYHPFILKNGQDYYFPGLPILWSIKHNLAYLQAKNKQTYLNSYRRLENRISHKNVVPKTNNTCFYYREYSLSSFSLSSPVLSFRQYFLSSFDFDSRIFFVVALFYSGDSTLVVINATCTIARSFSFPAKIIIQMVGQRSGYGWSWQESVTRRADVSRFDLGHRYHSPNLASDPRVRS